MRPTNAQLLRSQQALQELVQSKLPGTAALTVRDVAEAVQNRVERLQEVRKDLASRDQEEAEEEWTEVLDDTLEIDEEPIPETALENAEIAAADLFALDWMLDRGEDSE